MESFGRYRLVEQIGDGGMGVIYRALDESDTRVVVKRVRPELARDPGFGRMLKREARLSALMDHPGLVRTIDSGEHGDELFVVFEYVDGYDLSQVLTRATMLGVPPPIGVICYVAQRVLEALAYVHTLADDAGKPLGIIHRDISPSNVMLTKTGGIKLLDFGIAKVVEQSADERTQTGVLKGKLGYMSPEQVECKPLDARADLFSLGAVLFEAFAQRRLFRGATELDTLRRIAEADIPKLSRVREGINPALDAVMAKLLARDRDQRFANAAEAALAMDGPIDAYGGSAEASSTYLRSIEPIVRERTRQSRSSPDENATAVLARRTPSATKLTTSMPRWRAFVEGLPNGLDSFPTYQAKAVGFRMFLEQYGAACLPPDVPELLHELARNPPPMSVFVPEVVSRAMLLAMLDGLGFDDDRSLAEARALNERLIASPVYRMLFFLLSPEMVLRRASERWQSFHRGIKLEHKMREPYRCEIKTSAPAPLETELMFRTHATVFEVVCRAAGGKDVRQRFLGLEGGVGRIELTWR